ncbi:MAG: ornithine cyclodeaminase family protein [Acidimicrobiaceae bacterium]|nr:ornithine cyclodeaminase family protein [Acidimicrobiaceae bacterium]
MTLVLSIEEQREILDMKNVLEVLEILYKEEAAGRALSRRRSDTIVPNKTGVYGLKSMDGVVPAFDVGVVRINSDVITWPVIGKTKRRVKVPAAPGGRWVGLMLLFSISTGEPLAIMPDGFVQRMRVGGTSGLGVKYLARQDVKVLGLIGSGWQAGAQVLAACEVRNFERVVVYSPNRENLVNFVDEIGREVQVEVSAADSSEEVLSAADVLLCATNSIQPVFDGLLVRPGQHLGCIRHCEFDENAFKRIDRMIIHSPNASPMHQVMDEVQMEELAGDQGWADDHGGVDWNNVPTVSQLITGQVEGRKSDEEVTCFANNIGLGVQFAAVGARLLQIAREKGVGHELPTEWFTQNVHP